MEAGAKRPADGEAKQVRDSFRAARRCSVRASSFSGVLAFLRSPELPPLLSRGAVPARPAASGAPSTPPQLLRMLRAGKALLVRYDSVPGPKQDRHKDQAPLCSHRSSTRSKPAGVRHPSR